MYDNAAGKRCDKSFPTKLREEGNKKNAEKMAMEFLETFEIPLEDLYIQDLENNKTESALARGGIALPKEVIEKVSLSELSREQISNMLFADYMELYLNEAEKRNVEEITLDGYGPRHLAFSSDGEFVYCVNEIVSSVSVFFYNNGRLSYCDTYKYPLDSTKNNAAAAIRIKDKYLYTSTRGADIITCFEIQGKKLRFIKNTSCGGSNSRDFLIVDDSMFVTNEFTNDVTVLKLKNGTPELTDIKLHMLKPICVVAN